jgi:flagellar hook assembly protein FlgD
VKISWFNYTNIFWCVNQYILVYEEALFSERTTVSFTIPGNMNVSLAIYDLQGRLVRRLAHGWLNIGYKEYAWDGKDMKGVPVGSGVYFYGLKAGKRELSK